MTKSSCEGRLWKIFRWDISLKVWKNKNRRQNLIRLWNSSKMMQTETVTDPCPSSGQFQCFHLLLYVCSIIEKVWKGKRFCFATSREKEKKATEILRREKRKLKISCRNYSDWFFEKYISNNKTSNKKKRTPTQNDCLGVRQESTVKSLWLCKHKLWQMGSLYQDICAAW